MLAERVRDLSANKAAVTTYRCSTTFSYIHFSLHTIIRCVTSKYIVCVAIYSRGEKGRGSARTQCTIVRIVYIRCMVHSNR